MKPTANTIFIILTACVVAGGAFWYFSSISGVEAPLTSGSGPNEKQVEFQTLVTQLQPVSFNTTIFSDPHFLELQDITTQIAQEQIGRPDPFAPVAGLRAP
jgi:hypothetical protein